MLFKRPIIAQSMRPGCIFVSHRSILIWFAFFMPLQILQACLGFFPSLVCHFLNAVIFLIFQKKSFSEALLLITSIWWVETWSFHTVRGFIWSWQEWIPSGRLIIWNYIIFLGFFGRWAVYSAVQWWQEYNTPQITNEPGPCGVLPLPPAPSFMCIFIHTIFFWLLFSTRWIYLFNMRNPKIFFHISV